MRDLDRWKDKVELSLDGRQIFFLFFGSAVAACLIFVLGVLIGKRLEARALALQPAPVEDPLAALDQLGEADEADEGLTFHKALTGNHRQKAEPASASLDEAKPVEASRSAAEPKLAEAQKPAVEVEAPKAKAELPRLAARAEAPRSAAHSETPKPAHPEAPRPAVTVVDKPAVAVTERPAVAVTERPAVAVVEKPAVAVVEKPAVAVVEKPAVAVVEKPAPAEKPPVRPAAPLPAGKPQVVAAAAKKPDAAAGHFTLQLSAFPDKSDAEEFMHKIQAAGYRPFLVASEVPGKGLFYRVRVGDYATRQAAVDAKAEFERKQRMIAYVARL